MTLLQIKHPESELEFELRDRLLQQSLRQPLDAISIVAEYPLLLAPESAKRSFVGLIGDQPVVHANLWPRTLMAPNGVDSLRIGLVANVATHPDWRNRGFCAELLNALANSARAADMSALVLWSDLQQFYQKLGFESCSREVRVYVSAIGDGPELDLKLVAPEDYHRIDFGRLSSMRPKHFWTLARSQAEFRCFLEIPATRLYMGRVAGEECYAVCGKGCDLRGVIHEWGARAPRTLAEMAQGIARDLGVDQITVLTPTGMPDEWGAYWQSIHAKSEEFDMAMMKPLTSAISLEMLRSGTFIWGLDSV